jgi:glycosidase
VIRYPSVASILCAAMLMLVLPAARAQVAGASASPAGITTHPAQGRPASGVYYEIFVRSFADSNGDGIGDLDGVTAKLDYLHWLGVSGIWLMPIFPSPSYHGYDITDYRAVNPQYGSIAAFERLVAAAHARGIKVIIDLVANHTSNDHPWFKAAQNPASPYHDWYLWAGPHTDLEARSPWGGPVWRTLGTQHYMGIFDTHMPDLNYDNPAVREAMIAIGRFWLEKGADGFRLDAAKHIFDKFKSNDHSLAIMDKDAAWWSEFRQGIDAVNPHAYLVGEVSGDHSRLLAPFFRPLNAVFDFPLAPRLIASAASERDDHLGATLVHIQDVYRAAAGRIVKDAPFLGNHDRERVMSDLHGNLDHMKVAAALLLTLPGHPFVYYGEEIGMRGVKPDPSDREPMRWDRSRTAPGEATWEVSPIPASEDVSVAAERGDPHSLLTRYRELIHWRKDIAPLRDGVIADYPTGDAALAAWRLSDAGGSVLVVHNLSGAARELALKGRAVRRFTSLLRSTRPGATVRDGTLKLPPYTSVVLTAHPAAARAGVARSP